jgi:hypothetical protein
VLQTQKKKVPTMSVPNAISFFSKRLMIQSPRPSATLVEAERTPENTEGDPGVPEPTAEEISKWNTLLISCAAEV